VLYVAGARQVGASYVGAPEFGIEELGALEDCVQLRYLVRFDDGGSGMRLRGGPLDVGVELAEGADRYRVTRVEQPPNERSFGHAWAELVDA
jgi:hypothetical protein